MRTQEIEQFVLGGLLVDARYLDDVDVAPDDFESPTHRAIMQAIIELSGDRSAVDVVTVAERLTRIRPQEGDALGYLATLANSTPSTYGLVDQAAIVRDRAQQRRALACVEAARQSIQAEGMPAVDALIAELMQLQVSRGDARECVLSDAIAMAMDRLDQIQNHGEARGLSTGLRILDDKLGGLQDGELYVVGGRPSMGKTAMMLTMALGAGVPVGIFSGEQPTLQLGQRAVGALGGISSTTIRRAQLTDADWPKAVSAMSEARARPTVVIDDTPSPTIEYVMRRARQWAKKYAIRAVYVDYVQRMSSTHRNDTRAAQIDEICRGLKTLGGELQLPVVALAQVNREVEKRQNKRPFVSDLKDSGAIEQEADTIMLLYRDEVYNEDTKEVGICEVNVAKQRNGPTGMVRVSWVEDLMTFEDML